MCPLERSLMRSVAVIDVVLRGACPTRPTNGVERRRAVLLRALVQLGSVHVRLASPLTEREWAETEAYGVESIRVIDEERFRSRRRAGREVRVPRRQPGVACDRSFGAHRYEPVSTDKADVVIFEQLGDLDRHGSWNGPPVILDLDDVESVFAVQRLRFMFNHALDTESSTRLLGLPTAVRKVVIPARRTPRLISQVVAGLTDAARLRRAERRAISRCATVFVCSEEDRQRLGAAPSLVCVPNAFDLEGPPAGRLDVGRPATLCMWGEMTYKPNIDGAKWFVRKVLPRLRQRDPDLRVVIAGNGSDQLGLDRVEGVEVTGFAQDLGAVLERIDVAVVPLRAGVGTRIKILEAWANRIPVVSTTIGAYGLGATGGHDILTADTPKRFAAAIQTCLSDRTTRERLAEHGAVRAAEFSTGQVTEQIVELVGSAIDAGRTGRARANSRDTQDDGE